ncbi:hypothetical protein [Hymenobacter jeollabukensis]|uniref:6-bladed beta-propeller n=1 Tax=Hymenobacter jeollabukensis TaxID=2025313 RepID=A0A5R8WQB5_9BACT|nr:hypothetical protein [Hymenobacter jeollabukensis]TLM92212.1 hypothetical protein FDY95_12280 [Hymenobacter jeollabukensis]
MKARPRWLNARLGKSAAAALGLTLLGGAPALAQTTTPQPTAPAEARPAAQLPATTAAPAANLTLVRTVPLVQPGPASLDRRGNLYVTDARNSLRQFGPDGQPLATYSPPLVGHTGSVEAWNAAKILVYYDDRQELLVLDRFLAPIGGTRFSEIIDNGLIRLATIAPDDNLWLLNESNLTLLQYSSAQQRVTVATPLDVLLGRTKPDFRFLREYQNNLYLVDRTSGVWVFDNLGNFRKRLPISGLSWAGFRGDELYYLRDGLLHFYHLYSFQERTVLLPAPDATQVLVGEHYLYILTPTGFSVYQLPR